MRRCRSYKIKISLKRNQSNVAICSNVLFLFTCLKKSCSETCVCFAHFLFCFDSFWHLYAATSFGRKHFYIIFISWVFRFCVVTQWKFTERRFSLKLFFLFVFFFKHISLFFNSLFRLRFVLLDSFFLLIANFHLFFGSLFLSAVAHSNLILLLILLIWINEKEN